MKKKLSSNPRENVINEELREGKVMESLLFWWEGGKYKWDTVLQNSIVHCVPATSGKQFTNPQSA